MTPSVIRLDPDLPVCWEDAYTLRIGFDRAVARLHRPSRGVQRMLEALRGGVRSERLEAFTRHVGVSPGEASQVFVALRPVLLNEQVSDAADSRGSSAGPDRLSHPGRRRTAHDAPTPLNVRLSDDSRHVTALESAMARSGLCSVLSARDPETECDLVVIVERFFEPLERSRRWLRSGTPHLIIRFTDTEVQVGPLVSGHGRPCLSCLARQAVERDPALPALAAQLIGTPAASESPAATELAAAVAMSFIRRWREGDTAVHRGRVSLRVRRGRVAGAPVFESVRPHPDCACGELLRLCPSPEDQASPSSVRNLEGMRPDRPPLAVPDSRKESLARVSAT